MAKVTHSCDARDADMTLHDGRKQCAQNPTSHQQWLACPLQIFPGTTTDCYNILTAFNKRFGFNQCYKCVNISCTTLYIHHVHMFCDVYLFITDGIIIYTFRKAPPTTSILPVTSVATLHVGFIVLKKSLCITLRLL